LLLAAACLQKPFDDDVLLMLEDKHTEQGNTSGNESLGKRPGTIAQRLSSPAWLLLVA